MGLLDLKDFKGSHSTQWKLSYDTSTQGHEKKVGHQCSMGNKYTLGDSLIKAISVGLMLLSPIHCDPIFAQLNENEVINKTSVDYSDCNAELLSVRYCAITLWTFNHQSEGKRVSKLCGPF